VEGGGVAGDRRPGDARLLGQRGPQAVDDAAVLGALADREHGGRGGAQDVVDHDPARRLEPGPDRERRLRPHARGDHDQVGG